MCSFLTRFFLSRQIVSLLILDELDDSIHSTRLPPSLLRHSSLPPSRQQLASLKELGLFPTLPSRKTDPSSDGSLEDDASVARTLTPEEEAAELALLNNLNVDWQSDSYGMPSDADEPTPPLDELPSLVFGGSASSLEGISLWTILWDGLGVNLSDWNVDISQLNYSSDITPSAQSAQRIAYQQLLKAGATGSGSSSPSSASSSTAPASVPARKERQISVLHELRAHQGIAPFMSLSGDGKEIRLALVHAFFQRGPSDTSVDSRGDGLIEWFVRPAAPLLYPPTPPSTPPSSASSIHPLAAALSGNGISDATLDTVASSLLWPFASDGFVHFPSDPPVRSSSTAASRRQSIDGDWTLSEWCRIPGVIHAQSATNLAGNGGRFGEQEFTVVAYEELALDGVKDASETKIQVFFQPIDHASQPTTTTSTSSASSTHPSRLSLIIPLQTLRLVTAISLKASRIHLPDADRCADVTVLFALRGDKYVFRSVKVTAAKEDHEWKLTYSTQTLGPLAKRTNFISQTVFLQPYVTDEEFDDDDIAPHDSDVEARDSDESGVTSSPSPPPPPPPAAHFDNSTDFKVIASELNWAQGPVILAGPLATGTLNKWHAPNKKGRMLRMNQHVQEYPPFAAGIYSPVDVSDRDEDDSDDELSSPWIHDSWITSSKTVGKYGANVHPLSIHRGDDGGLTPLVTAASANHRFVAFAQVPLITTIDGNHNFEPIEIVHLEPETAFTGLAFNQKGTILAVADNHQDIIILHRTEQAAQQYKYDQQQQQQQQSAQPTSTPAPTTDSATTADAASGGAPPSEAPSQPADSTAPPVDDQSTPTSAPAPTPAPTPTPTPPAPAPARKRHAWEVMGEVIFPKPVKHLSLLSVQLVDVPVPIENVPPVSIQPSASDDSSSTSAQSSSPSAEQSDAAQSSTSDEMEKPTTTAVPSPSAPSVESPSDLVLSADKTTPFLILLFQGGVIGTIPLKCELTPTVHQATSNHRGGFSFPLSTRA